MENARSCWGCRHYLGGGCCKINMEMECREGGGFELYELPEEYAPEELPKVYSGLDIPRAFIEPKPRRERLMWLGWLAVAVGAVCVAFITALWLEILCRLYHMIFRR